MLECVRVWEILKVGDKTSDQPDAAAAYPEPTRPATGSPGPVSCASLTTRSTEAALVTVSPVARRQG